MLLTLADDLLVDHHVPWVSEAFLSPRRSSSYVIEPPTKNRFDFYHLPFESTFLYLSHVDLVHQQTTENTEEDDISLVITPNCENFTSRISSLCRIWRPPLHICNGHQA